MNDICVDVRVILRLLTFKLHKKSRLKEKNVQKKISDNSTVVSCSRNSNTGMLGYVMIAIATVNQRPRPYGKVNGLCMSYSC